MLQQVEFLGGANFGGGLVTYPNFFALQPNQTPNVVDIKFALGGMIEKRLGSTTLNATVIVSSAATGFTPDSAGTLSTSLQAFWKLNETVGTRLDEYGTVNLTDANNNVGFGSGVLANAASFVAASTSYFSIASNNAVIQMGSAVDFTVSCWVRLDSNGSGQSFVSKDSGGTTADYKLRYNVSTDRFEWLVSVDTLGNAMTVQASNLGTPSTATWYLLVGWIDSANRRIGIRINTLTADTLLFSAATTPQIGPAPLTMGADGNLSQRLSGLLDEAGVWKKVLTNQEQLDLWNGGAANTYSKGRSNSGWALFDFGAGFASGLPLRWLTVAAGTGIYASSNRGQTLVVIATDRGADYQSFERSKSFLIATSDTGNKVLYWAGSVGTFMAALAPGSAPPSKYALDFQGFLLLMNDSGGRRRIVYADNTQLLTDQWTTTFELPSSYDDEITGGIILNKKAYVSTKFKLYRVSAVGGNPDFAYQEVKNWGWVPGTQAKITLPDLGEVICCLGWDRKLRLFDGAEDRLISDSVELNNGLSDFSMSDINLQALHKARAVVDTEEQVYKLWVALQGSINTTHCLHYNFRTGAFYPYQNQPFQSAVMAESGNTRILVGVKRDGFLHWINTTNTDAGVAINEHYESPPLFRLTPKAVSKSQSITLYFFPTSSGTLYYQDQTNFTKAMNPPRQTFRLIDTSTVLQVQQTIDIPLTQNVYRWFLSSSANTAQPWRLSRVDYALQDLGFGKG